jgi:hypothetical protein
MGAWRVAGYRSAESVSFTGFAVALTRVDAAFAGRAYAACAWHQTSPRLRLVVARPKASSPPGTDILGAGVTITGALVWWRLGPRHPVGT